MFIFDAEIELWTGACTRLLLKSLPSSRSNWYILKATSLVIEFDRAVGERGYLAENCLCSLERREIFDATLADRRRTRM